MKTTIIIFAILFLSLFSVVASAIPIHEAVPGDMVELKVTNLQLSTGSWPVVGIITGGWTPAYVKWYLIDPYGHIVYMIDKPIDSVTKVSVAAIGESTWSITSDAGLVEVPAFATSGMWTVQAKFYDVNHLGFITWSNSANPGNLAPFYVQDASFLYSLNAPVYVYWNVFGFEISFALPHLIFLILIIVVIIIVILNLIAFRRRRK